MRSALHASWRQPRGRVVGWAAVLSLLALALVQPAVGQITNGVYLPNSTPYGKTYVEWTVAWHQWANSLETTHHPLYDTADPSAGQSGPVWFLGGHWANDGVMARSLVIPQGTALFFPIMVVLADNTGCPTPSSYTEAQLLSSVQSVIDQVYSVTCTIDGIAVPNLLSSYRFQTPSFNYTDPPNNNMLEVAEGEPCYSDLSPTPTPFTVNGAVADGYYLMTAPLGPGSHTIHFTGASGSFFGGTYEDMTYNISVVSSNLGNPLVSSPDSVPYGKTYSQWAAAYWSWAYALPVDQNPLFGTAALSTGQSNDVWFLGGSLITTNATGTIMGGSAVRTATIPEGTALFFPLVAAEAATAEGHGTNYGQLYAAAQFLLDHATNLSCAVDGQPLANLSHYRAQSPLFTWGPLPTNNIFADPTNYPNGLSSQSVADGYFLLLAPLAAGAHTIHFTGGLSLSTVRGDPYNLTASLDITYNLSVVPVSLGIVLNGSNAVLSWPQVASNYLLESTGELSAGQWSAVGGTPQTIGSNYELTIPVTNGIQLFRLRKP